MSPNPMTSVPEPQFPPVPITTFERHRAETKAAEGARQAASRAEQEANVALQDAKKRQEDAQRDVIELVSTVNAQQAAVDGLLKGPHTFACIQAAAVIANSNAVLLGRKANELAAGGT